MHWQYTPYTVTVLIAATISGALMLWGWRRRPAPGASWFTALMFSAFSWALCYGLEMVSADLPTTLLWSKMQYFGAVSLTVGWLALVLTYTGQRKWLTPRNVALLFIIPLITLVLVWTNERHELIWENVGLATNTAFNTLSFTPGVWYWVNIAYAYAIFVFSTVLLVIALVHSMPLYRRQIVILLIFSLITWIGNLAYIIGLTPQRMDLTPVTFSVSGLLIAWGLFRYRILDIVPVARDVIVESMSDGMIALDPENQVVDINPVAQALIGHTLPEVIGQPIAQVLSVWPTLAKLCQESGSIHTEVTLNIGEREQRIFDLRVSPLHDRHERLTGRLMFWHDITERKQMETETRLLLTLTQSVSTATDLTAALHAALRLIVEHTGWVLGEAWLPSADGTVMENSRASYCYGHDMAALERFDQISCEFTFAPNAGLPGRVWASGQPEWQRDITDLSPQVYLRVQHAMEAGLKAALGVPVLVGGRALAVLVFYMAEPRAKDRHLVELISAVAAQLGAVLQNKQVEEAMRLQAAALDAAANSIVITDRAGKITWVNPAFTQLTGYTSEEVIGQNPRLLKSGHHDLVFFEHLWETILAGQAWQGEIVNRRQDGSTYIEEQTITPVRDGQGEISYFVAIKQDITARKQTEAALRESEERFRSMTQSANDAIIIADGEGRILLWNRGAQTIFGYQEEEVSGKSLAWLMPERYRNAHQNGVERLNSTGESHVTGRLIELEGLRRDGSEFPLAMSISSWEAGGERLFGAIVRDITERKQAEEALRQYAAELEMQNAELDAFAHTVAHDLKAPLSTIVGFSGLLSDRFTNIPDEQRQDFLRRIERSGFKMRDIVDELLLLASVREMAEIQIHPLDMEYIVAQVRERLDYLIEEHQAKVVLPDSWPVALGYGPWVEEVWANYISNALKYGGRPPRVEMGASVEADGGVRFWARDNGPGLSSEEQARLFTPFERLHQVRVEGQGLGLSIVRRIVEKLGGRVGVESKEGKGSAFYFILPGAE